MKVGKLLGLAEEEYLQDAQLKILTENCLCAATGIAVFPVMLGVMQKAWKTLGVSSHLKIAPACGLVTLILSSTASVFATTSTQKYFRDNNLNHFKYLFCEKEPQVVFFIGYGLIYSCLSISTFWLYGGRLRNLLPSHILNPGAFAVGKVTLPEITGNVTKPRQNIVQDFGQKYGCHTCGKKYPPMWKALKSLWFNKILGQTRSIPVNYISDHIPPQALAKEFSSYFRKTTGALYPQCESCSLYQSSRVKMHLNGTLKLEWRTALITHITTLRIHKIWIPWPLLLQPGLLEYFIQMFIQ